MEGRPNALEGFPEGEPPAVRCCLVSQVLPTADYEGARQAYAKRRRGGRTRGTEGSM